MTLRKLSARFAASAVFLSALLSPALVNAATASDSGQPVAADFFSRAPMELVSQLPANHRLDMLDYFAGGSKVRVNNRLNVKVGLKSVNDMMIVYQDNDSITTAIAVLPTAGNDTVLMLIRTFPPPTVDSSIAFYDSSWKPLKKPVIDMPTLADRLVDKSAANNAATAFEMPFMLETIEYDPVDRTLTFTNALDSFYTDSDRPQLLDNLRKSLTYKWNGKKFILRRDP